MKVISLLLLVVGSLLRPTHAHCPPRWWLSEGVRATGEYVCTPDVAPRWERGPRGGWYDASAASTARVESKIWCTGGSVAITNDGRTVGCQARH